MIVPKTTYRFSITNDFNKFAVETMTFSVVQYNWIKFEFAPQPIKNITYNIKIKTNYWELLRLAQKLKEATAKGREEMRNISAKDFKRERGNCRGR